MNAIELQSGCGKRFQPHGGAQPSTAAGRQPIRAALFLRLWFGTVGFTLSLCLALAAGCQHRLPRTSSALPSPALGTPAVPQPYPVSRMSHSGLAPAAHSTACRGACCRSASYQAVFPELATREQAVVHASGYPANLSSPASLAATCFNATPCPPPPCPPPPRFLDPNEYVYDGGDREPTARLRPDLTVAGLDSEDTVIRYQTESGCYEVQAGCRVPVYAPRFAATRKIRSLGYQDQIVAAQAALRKETPSRVQDALPPTGLRLQDQPLREASVKVVEAYRDRQRGLGFDKVLPAIAISEAFKPYEDLAVIRDGVLAVEDAPRLQRSAQAALAWTNIDNLAVTVDQASAVVVEESQGPAEVFFYELSCHRLRLCKVASHQLAEPGDIIDFTIRFDNVGDQDVSNIAIHDSLSPRLEYVPDSQKTNRPSAFEQENNDVGSSVLSWTFEDKLAPGEGGLIRFQCKVR